MEHTPERQYYRIVYPLKVRPRLLVGGQEFPILDCSERGVRYHAMDTSLPELETVISGRIQFRQTTMEVAILGSVVRIRDGTVALHLEPPGIPLAAILAEQRFLRINFPMHD